MELDDLVSLLSTFQDEEKSLNFANTADLFYDDGECCNKNCSGKYKIVDDYDSTNLHHKKLQSSLCHDQKSLYYNSIFQNTNLPIRKIPYLIYLWVTQIKVYDVMRKANVARGTVKRFYKLFRKACEYRPKIEDHPIGVPVLLLKLMKPQCLAENTTLEELHLLYGCLVTFVGRQGNVSCILFQTEKKKKTKLIHIFQNKILSQSKINSDMGPSYRCLNT